MWESWKTFAKNKKKKGNNESNADSNASSHLQRKLKQNPFVAFNKRAMVNPTNLPSTKNTRDNQKPSIAKEAVAKPKPSWPLTGTVEHGCRHGKPNDTVDIGPRQRGPQDDPIGNMIIRMAKNSNSSESEEDSVMPESHQKMLKKQKMSIGRGLEVCNILEEMCEKAMRKDDESEESRVLEKMIQKS